MKQQPYRDEATGNWVCPRCGRANFKSPQQVYGHWRFCKGPAHAWETYQKAVGLEGLKISQRVEQTKLEELEKRVGQLERVVYNELTHLQQQYEKRSRINWERVIIFAVLVLCGLALLDMLGLDGGTLGKGFAAFARTAGSQLAKKIS